MKDGLVYDAPVAWESTAHGAGNGPYYLVVQILVGMPTLVWLAGPWAFNEIQVAFITYSGPASANTFCQRECHGIGDYRWHEVLHDQIGTFRDSGGAMTVGTYTVQPASPTNADNRPGVDICSVMDEDLLTAVALLAQAGPYTTLRFTGTGTPTFDLAATDIYRKPSGSYLHYNKYLAGSFSEVEGSAARYYNVWLIAMPAAADAQSQLHRYWWVQPQVEHTSAAAAAAEDIRTLQLGSLAQMAPEFVAITRVTLRTLAAYGTVGRCRIEAVGYLAGSRANQALVAATAIPVHNSLLGRDELNAHPATAISYDPTASGLAAVNVQAAIDELAGPNGPVFIPIVLARTLYTGDGVQVATGQFSFAAGAYGASTFKLQAIAWGIGTVGTEARVRLYNLTDSEYVTAADVSTTLQVATLLQSAALTVGVAAGDLKTAETMYEARLDVSSGVLPLDAAHFGSVFLRMEA
jgi:hypothetical protein